LLFPTIDLCNQWNDKYKDYFIEGLGVNVIMYGGKVTNKILGTYIFISTYDSYNKYQDKLTC
jgi:hypothetical protein